MIPTIPNNAPFSREQRSWLNGFFAGLYSVQEVDPAALGIAETAASDPAVPVTVLFGSQTGTAERLAKKTAKRLNQKGFAAMAKELDAVSAADLVEVEHLLVVTSTYGDGEMPDNAQSFWDALADDEAPRLERTTFSVCALGDISYPDFCQAGRDLDARLEALGAERLHPRVDCDGDFDEPFDTWLNGVQHALAVPSGDGALASAQIQERV
jgi:sulfite reductase (NADPH) flavoprotein alpha-component